MKKKTELDKIQTGQIARGLKLSRFYVSSSTSLAKSAIRKLFLKEEQKGSYWSKLLSEQTQILSKEFGELKGSFMKVGQMLSIYGEHFLPPEANQFLKQLQMDSPPLKWERMRPLLEASLGDDYKSLKVNPGHLAAASLAQVYEAEILESSERIVLKIRYPGVDTAIDSDLAQMKRILTLLKLAPKSTHYDAVFSEVRTMLKQEVDYEWELEQLKSIAQLLKDDDRFVLPRAAEKYCRSNLIAMSFEEGSAVDSIEVANLSQSRRNQLGLAAVELFFRELFRWGKVQTDPHFGNYRIRIDQGAGHDQWVLFDFGATRIYDPSFLDKYHAMLRGTFEGNARATIEAAKKLGFITVDDSHSSQKVFFDVCRLFLEPFHDVKDNPSLKTPFHDLEGQYDFAASDLPTRVAKKGSELVWSTKLRAPPPEIVFLDRKMAGLYILLKVLRVKLNLRPLLEQYLP